MLVIISGITLDERKTIVTQLESLGVKVSDSPNYDPAGTHLICPKLARNEKILCCMAAGKWILHTSYVDSCVTAGKLLDVCIHEISNIKLIRGLPNILFILDLALNSYKISIFLTNKLKLKFSKSNNME